MPLWQPKHQFTQSLHDFLLKILGVLFGVPGAPTQLRHAA